MKDHKDGVGRTQGGGGSTMSAVSALDAALQPRARKGEDRFQKGCIRHWRSGPVSTGINA